MSDGIRRLAAEDYDTFRAELAHRSGMSHCSLSSPENIELFLRSLVDFKFGRPSCTGDSSDHGQNVPLQFVNGRRPVFPSRTLFDQVEGLGVLGRIQHDLRRGGFSGADSFTPLVVANEECSF